jgi:fibronectin type 3 domain-containing protein
MIKNTSLQNWQWIYLGLLTLVLFTPSKAQQKENNVFVVPYNGHTAVMIMEQVPLGFGWMIYRKSDNEKEFQLLHEEPIGPAIYPEEMALTMGADYQRMLKVSQKLDPAALHLHLLSNREAGELAALFSPATAKALGRRFDDIKQGAQKPAVYKLVLVDDTQKPTGKEYQINYVPRNATPETPTQLQVRQKGMAVHAEWRYPTKKNQNDQVVQFELLVRTASNPDWQRVHEDFILRDDSKDSHSFSFLRQKLGEKLDVGVVAVDVAGNRSLISTSAQVTIVDQEPPAAIQKLDANFFNGVVYLSWPLSPEADLAGFKIYRGTENGSIGTLLHKGLLPLDQTFYEDKTAREGKAYLYRVAAVDAAGNEGPASAAVQVRVPIVTPPPAFKGLMGTFTKNKTIQLNWQGSGATPNLMHALVIRQSPGNTVGWDIIETSKPTLNTFLDNGPKDGFLEGAYYKYGVFLLDSARNSGDTIFATVKIPDLTPPNPPADLTTFLAHNDLVRLNWKPSTSGDVAGYRLYKNAGGKNEMMAEVTATTTRLQDEKIELGATYVYSITAVDSLKNESKPFTAQPLLVRSYDPPRKLVQVQAIAQEQGVKVVWPASPEQRIAQYNIYQSNISTGVFEKVGTVGVKLTEYLHTAGKKGNWYRVTAVDEFGNEGAMSAPVICK